MDQQQPSEQMPPAGPSVPDSQGSQGGVGSRPQGPLPQAMPFTQAPPLQPPAWAPPWMYPQLPPRRSHGCLIASLISGAIGLFVLVVVVLAVKAGEGRAVYQKQEVREGKSDKIVAVVPLYGLVDGSMAQFAERVLDALKKDKAVVAVVLRVDTPGGTVSASDQINQAIRKFRKECKDKPVVISQGGYATSGGYYISVAGERIFAEPTTLTGNIGVIVQWFNVHDGLTDKLGVKPVVITSRHTPFKDAPSMYKEMSTTQAEYVQTLVESAYDRFVKVVVEGRETLKALPPDKIYELADGKAYTAEQALKAQLIDEIGYAEDAYDYAAKQAHASDAKVVRYMPRPTTLGDLLFSRSPLPAMSKQESPVQQVEGLLSWQMLYLYHNQDFVRSWPTLDYSGR